MRYALLLILTMMVFVTDKGWAAGRCELDLSPRSRVLFRMIELGLNDHSLTSEDVDKFLAAKEWDNPYLEKDKTTRVLFYRNNFGKYSSGATPNDKRQVRAALGQLLLKHRGNQQAVAVAKVKTEQVLAPRILGTVSYPGLSNGNMPFAPSWLDGRPIFVGRLARKSNHRQYTVVFDPFHPNPNFRTQLVQGTEGVGSPADPTEFFTKDGVPFALDFMQNFYLDLRQMMNVQPPSENSDDDPKAQAAVLVDTKRGPKIIATISSFKNLIVEYDALQREEPRILAKEVNVHQKRLRKFQAGNKIYVPYSTGDKVYVYEASEGRIIKRFKINGSEDVENHTAVFALGRKRKVAFVELSEDARYSRLRLRDLKDDTQSTILYKIQGSPNLELVNLGGVPHIYFFDEEHLVLVNLKTEQFETFPVGLVSDAVTVKWKDRTCVVWGTDRGELKFFDLGLRVMLNTFRLFPEGDRDTSVFSTIEYKGQIYAIVNVMDEGPYFVQLTDGGGE